MKPILTPGWVYAYFFSNENGLREIQVYGAFLNLTTCTCETNHWLALIIKNLQIRHASVCYMTFCKRKKKLTVVSTRLYNIITHLYINYLFQITLVLHLPYLLYVDALDVSLYMKPFWFLSGNSVSPPPAWFDSYVEIFQIFFPLFLWRGLKANVSTFIFWTYNN
jgi:hypothetical protein